uniref:Uncharacterized protein n=1 Tax=Ornithodoros moubata TaxID=6938 RepID=A0A1Z5KYQ1_ORNMO
MYQLRLSHHLSRGIVLYGYLLWMATVPASCSPLTEESYANPHDPPPDDIDQCSVQHTSFDIGDRSTCTFIQTEDVVATRIPRVLPKVQCKCRNQQCSNYGDFTCQEIRQSYEVAYRKSPSSGQLKYENVTLTSGCVCATSRSISVPFLDERTGTGSLPFNEDSPSDEEV